MDKTMVRVLLVVPGKHPKPAYLTADSIINVVACLSVGEVENVKCKEFEENVYAIYNGEGALLDLQGNRRIDGMILTGLFFVVETDGYGKIVSLSDDMLGWYENFLWEPEKFCYREVLDAYFADKYQELDEIVL